MITLIPMPKNISESGEYFSFEKKNATVFSSPELSAVTEMLEPVLGFGFAAAKESATVSFIFDSKEQKEGYSLIIDKNGARVFAADYSGAFYGLQTLRQLFSADLKKNSRYLTSRHVKITDDHPAYLWRGMQLDEARHFFGKDTVKKLLDFMAMYKLNVFHWHLTDDQGWRVQIEKYPLLTEIGSKRKGSQTRNWKSGGFDDIPVEGYYTRGDIAEIVEYAKKRGIDIVPEIDFPAHSASAIAAYNNLACREIPCEVPGYYNGIIPEAQGNKRWNRPLCLGKEEVYSFVFDVIDEVCEMFPFEYFHVGGDEAPTDEWKTCPLCQQKIKENGLANEVELQGYFTNRLNAHLKKNGKTMIGWNEVLAAKLLDRDIVAQYWTIQKDKNVTQHLRQGGKVILSNHRCFYFDMRHTLVTVKNTYTYDPLKHNVPKECLDSVLGLEGENWTEWTDSEDQLFFKIFNRGLALAETAWSDSSVKDYHSFTERLHHHKRYMDELGIYYGPDEITMKRNLFMKLAAAKRVGSSFVDYDCEYRMSKGKKK